MICRRCGCDELNPCIQVVAGRRRGCSWVDDRDGRGALCSACLPAVKLEVIERQLDAMKKLRVATAQREGDGAVLDQRALVIDASALLRSPVDVERWVLLHQQDGLWLHPESGERGPLSEVLRAIACVYLTAPKHASGETRRA